jgi:TolB-like protein
MEFLHFKFMDMTMLIENLIKALISCVIIAGLTSCVPADKPKTREEVVTEAIAQIPKTLAVLPFENNSVTDPEKYAPLTKGLSAMLTTDLQKSATSIQIIERGKITALLKEVALSQSGSVDSVTAVKAGKILGAQAIVFGSYMVLGEQVRIDARIVKVETSETLLAESITGNSGAFMDLENRLAKQIASSLKISLQPRIESKGSDINAALYFSEGVEAFDAGDIDGAKKLFDKSIALDPSYQLQVDNILVDLK